MSSSHSASMQQQQQMSGSVKSVSPLNMNLGSATSHGSRNDSPDAVRLSNIMNGPLSADTNPLSLDQIAYNPSTDRLGAGTPPLIYLYTSGLTKNCPSRLDSEYWLSCDGTTYSTW